MRVICILNRPWNMIRDNGTPRPMKGRVYTVVRRFFTPECPGEEFFNLEEVSGGWITHAFRPYDEGEEPGMETLRKLLKPRVKEDA